MSAGAAADDEPAEAEADGGPAAARVKDPLGVAAIVSGCIGIVVAGLALCVVTGVLAAAAGQRARETGASNENAYIGFVLAAVDGVVWIVLHLAFDIPFVLG